MLIIQKITKWQNMRRIPKQKKSVINVTDPTNFSKVNQDLYPTLLKHQDKNNRLADLLKKHGVINETTCSRLKTSGSRPGILYGLPKIHKRGVPMRPILSTIGTHNYNMSKWLVPKLSKLSLNQYTVRDFFFICQGNCGN